MTDTLGDATDEIAEVLADFDLSDEDLISVRDTVRQRLEAAQTILLKVEEDLKTLRKREYAEQIRLIHTMKRPAAITRGMRKLVQEFGTADEKHGVSFGLFPDWSNIEL